jgi:hypothetical protein
MTLLALGLAGGLALIHLVAGKLRFLDVIPRSAWLSAASGASVAYVFMHLLPELATGQETLAHVAPLEFLETHVWMVALVGLAVFYGLERAALSSREQEADDATEPGVFWLHIASFGLYNVLIGYLLLHREVMTTAALLLFAIAMGLHFFVNDYGLRQHHKQRYHRFGRWILAAAVLGGWALGAATEVSEALLVLLIAFLGGGVILNVLKEELPEERESRFWPFALGAVAYTALLVATHLVEV